MTVMVLAAFAAGVLALLSPCSALLLPSFFAYAFGRTSGLVLRTAAFYLGLLLTLVPLGTGAGAASRLFYGHRATLVAVAGWSIVALGAVQLLGGGFQVPGGDRLRALVARRDRGGWLGTVALGAVYGLAGFCSGPVLGAILTMAATGGSVLGGGLLLAVYALGMAAPLFLLAALWDRFDLGRRGWLRGRSVRVGRLRLHTTSLVSGALLVGIGALFLRFDGTAGIAGALGVPDTSGLEAGVQQSISDLAGRLPAWALPAAVAVTAGVVGWRRLVRASDTRPPAD